MEPQQSLKKNLVAIAWPIAIAQTAVMANGIIDSVMAGHISAADLATIGIGYGIFSTVFVTFMGVLLAIPSIVSHHAGAGRTVEIGNDIRQSFWLALLLSIIAMFIMYFPDPFLALANAPIDIEIKVRDYLRGMMWGFPGFLFFRVYYGMTSGIGHTQPMMLFHLLGLFLKVPINLLLMFGVGGFFEPLGAVGAAYSTAITFTLVCLLSWDFTYKNSIYAEYQIFSRFEWPNLSAQWEYLRLGLPVGLSLLIDVSSFTFMALFIARLGAVASAAHQIASSVAIALFMIPLSIGLASSVLIGQRLGAKKTSEAKMVGLMGLRFGIKVSLLSSIILFIFAPWIVEIYTKDHDIQTIAVNILRIVSVFHLTDSLQLIAVQILRGYKKMLMPTYIYLGSLWGIGLTGGYILGLTDIIVPAMGVAGFWWAATVGLAIAGILFIAYWHRISRQ